MLLALVVLQLGHACGVVQDPRGTKTLLYRLLIHLRLTQSVRLPYTLKGLNKTNTPPYLKRYSAGTSSLGELLRSYTQLRGVRF
jgi:hypothetical protein